jgi:putative OPT family oligopeptide transporter
LKGELTLRAIILGVILTIVFGAANAYLGLKAGMTVSASIPAAVMSMAILRGLMRRGTVLENNIVQTVASAGESLAAGVIFTIPALIFLGMDPTVFYIFILALTGGFLGVLLMIPLRKHLIEDEHEILPFPEGTACAEVLEAGEEGGEKAKLVFSGLGVGAFFKLLMSGFRLFSGNPSFYIPGLRTLLGFDISPSLLGVGYILGLRIASLVVAGGIFGWFVLIPLIAHFKGIPVEGEEAVFSLWNDYIRYIGAGAVLAGGVISLGRSFPAFTSALKAAGQSMTKRSKSGDLPMGVTLLGTVVIFLILFIFPVYKLSILGAALAIIFAFLFITVSARLVGIVGSSSNPISGMTIATLLFVSLIFAKLGISGLTGMASALSLGAIVCIAAAIAGDTSQDLKTGFLVNATPWRQQISEFIGVFFSAIFIGWTLLLLHKAYTLGSRELSAPQATLMSLVVKGVFEGTMPWILIFSGIFIAISMELFGIHSLPFAVGLYLPLELSTTIYVGGLVSKIVGQRKEGILFASGLVAGDALLGVILALFIVLNISLPSIATPSKIIGILAFIILILILGNRARRT